MGFAAISITLRFARMRASDGKTVVWICGNASIWMTCQTLRNPLSDAVLQVPEAFRRILISICNPNYIDRTPFRLTLDHMTDAALRAIKRPSVTPVSPRV